MKVAKIIKLSLATFALISSLYGNATKTTALEYAQISALGLASGALSTASGYMAYKIWVVGDCSVRNSWQIIKKARQTLTSADATHEEKRVAEAHLDDYGFDLRLGIPMTIVCGGASLCFAGLAGFCLKELAVEVMGT